MWYGFSAVLIFSELWCVKTWIGTDITTTEAGPCVSNSEKQVSTTMDNEH